MRKMSLDVGTRTIGIAVSDLLGMIANGVETIHRTTEERDYARIAELNEKVNDLYGKIMADEGMTAYNEAKKDCENLVNYIDAIINTAMNGGDPMTVQEPSASCTGSCSTCGGCH